MRFRAALLMLLCAATCVRAESRPVRIGCKNFTEQQILGELVAQLIERHTDLTAERRFGLGGTDICHAALASGQIDLYVEYTGTALLNVLKHRVVHNQSLAFRIVAAHYRSQHDLEWLPPLGFNNTYAVAVREADAERLNLNRISDLAEHGGSLSAGFTSEFMERPDGYPGLRKAYGLSFQSTVDLDPGLMYKAIADGQVDVIGAFATDGRIAEYRLRVLEDDRKFFPPYDAAPVMRRDLFERHPEIRDALAALSGSISDRQMRTMNHAVDVLKQDPAAVASAWIDRHVGGDARHDGPDVEESSGTFWSMMVARRGDIGIKTWQHLRLTLLGVLIAMGLGIPTGIAIHRRAAARGPVLAATEVVQTIPSLAMLAFLFAIYGLLGAVPAVTALVLYALLPIVLNTLTGLNQVPEEVVEAADGIGMSGRQRLRRVELPLAAPVIVAGIRASTVLTVGIATLCTYIGAGGLGDFIARGLARNDPRLTLLGAVPAALMAVCLSLLIRLAERRLARTAAAASP